MKFTLYTANVTGRENNCRYPNEAVITNVDELRAAVAFDHTCAKFKTLTATLVIFCMVTV